MSLSVLLIVNYVNYFMITLQPRDELRNWARFYFSPLSGVCFLISAQAWPVYKRQKNEAKKKFKHKLSGRAFLNYNQTTATQEGVL
jgi:hypothetical protein